MQPADNYQADLDDYLDDIRPDAGTFYTTGTIDFATGGYAFLRRKTTTADIFIPQQATGGAVTGDSVRAFVVADDSGRYEGCVVEVITRNCKPITGIVVMDSDLVTLLPYKPIGYTVVLETGATHLQDGDMILAHIVAWPGKPGDVIRASVRAACSAPHLPENALPSICLEFGIPLAFPPGVDAESAVIPRDVTTDDLEDRYDYRALPFITIDGETSRDLMMPCIWSHNRTVDGYYASQLLTCPIMLR